MSCVRAQSFSFTACEAYLVGTVCLSAAFLLNVCHASSATSAAISYDFKGKCVEKRGHLHS